MPLNTPGNNARLPMAKICPRDHKVPTHDDTTVLPRGGAWWSRTQNSSCVEVVAHTHPRGLAVAVDQLRVAQLVRQLQGVREALLLLVPQLQARVGLVLRLDAVAQVAAHNDLAVDALVVDTQMHPGIHRQLVGQAARVGHVVADGPICVRHAEVGMAACDATAVGALVGLRRGVALEAHSGLAAGHGHAKSGFVRGPADLVDAHRVLHAVGGLGTAGHCAPRAEAAGDAGIRGTDLGVQVHAGDLRQLLARHREVVCLVAVELHPHITHILYAAVLRGLPKQVLEVGSLATHAERSIVAQEARLPRLLVVHAEVEGRVPVQLRGVVRVEVTVVHEQSDTLAAVRHGREGHVRRQARSDRAEVALDAVLQGAGVALPTALHCIRRAQAAQAGDAHNQASEDGDTREYRAPRSHAAKGTSSTKLLTSNRRGGRFLGLRVS
mmetsp:Transcript_38983/g.123781  ORF Transcript_38983/g.123781 Transcript_38983/m.123781 type:complete len:439 (-) Transcript_38983:41-1357(-)